MKVWHALDKFDDRAENRGLECKDKSLTIQSQANETDINVIVARFVKSGVLPVRQLPPVFADFTGALTYQEAFDMVQAADASFRSLPAEVRSEFDNDPGRFVDFVEDPANLDKLREWGLIPPLAPVSVPIPAVLPV